MQNYQTRLVFRNDTIISSQGNMVQYDLPSDIVRRGETLA